MKKIKAYFKGRKFGWWFSNSLLLVIVLMLLIPSFRIWAVSNILRLTMSSPNVEKIQDAPVPTDEEFNLVAETTTGEIIRLPEHRGKVIFINLWATWCGPCIAEMNSLERLYDAYKDKVTFIFLSLEDPGVIRSFASRREMTIPLSWPVAYLPEMFHSNSYPTTFIVNKKGSIVVKETGASDWDSENVHELLDELIKE